MKNVSFTEVSDTLDALEKSKKTDAGTLADLVAVAKLASDRADEIWSRVKEFCKARNITEAKSDTVQVRASFRAGGSRYNADLLNAYFAKAKIDPSKFKKPVADSFVITIEQI